MPAKAKRYRVKVRVVEVKSPCTAGHRVGDEVIFEYNQVAGKLCFDAMCSMMAKVHSLRYGGQFPWLKNPDDPARHSCPDGSNVVFELSRILSG
ncbi:MAG: TIGR04076 family protein [Desulfarculaceae bacterium]|nr:TIGR04076 family protein [Desulfarculaceae bacterium]MCF8073181.1 TIGR04076 family protein [Desulfarculaceae bacterium]MCF8100777.1 TIGR04076 family protein [Desulfarculaceae bacterium]MCF8118424.1 TIGR04076 family protein [Desulfarculaceae bacterium]